MISTSSIMYWQTSNSSYEKVNLQYCAYQLFLLNCDVEKKREVTLIFRKMLYNYRKKMFTIFLVAFFCIESSLDGIV